MAIIRFDSLSPAILEALATSGWTPERAVDSDQWVKPLKIEGYRAHLLAEEVLSKLGGLSIEPINRVAELLQRRTVQFRSVRGWFWSP